MGNPNFSMFVPVICWEIKISNRWCWIETEVGGEVNYQLPVFSDSFIGEELQ